MTWSSITGWRKATWRGSRLVIGVLLATQVVAAAPPEAEPMPDMEFLEFLGSWQIHGGQWVDPLQVEELPAPDPDLSAEPRQEGARKKTGRGHDRQTPGVGAGSPPYPNDEVQPRKLGK